MIDWKRTLACGTLVLAAACGGDDSGDGPGADAAPQADAGPSADSSAPTPDAMPALTGIDALCADGGAFPALLTRFIDCSPQINQFLFAFGDVFRPAEIENFCNGDFADYVDDGSISIDDTVLSECLTYIAAAECYELNPDNFSGTPCDGLIVGAQAVDEDCERSEQCAGDAYCSSDGPQPAGIEPACAVCVARVAAGGDCNANVECTTGFCNGEGSCAARADLGEACEANGCIGTLQCDQETDVCVNPPVPAVGDACENINGDCGFPWLGLYCDEDANMCATIPAVGETCGPEVEFGRICNIAAYEYCDPIDTMCKAPIAVGAGDPCHALPTVGSGTRKCGGGLTCSGPFDFDDGGLPQGECFAPGLVDDACGAEDNPGCHPFLDCSGETMTCVGNEYSGMCPA